MRRKKSCTPQSFFPFIATRGETRYFSSIFSRAATERPLIPWPFYPRPPVPRWPRRKGFTITPDSCAAVFLTVPTNVYQYSRGEKNIFPSPLPSPVSNQPCLPPPSPPPPPPPPPPPRGHFYLFPLSLLCEISISTIHNAVTFLPPSLPLPP